jgi:hypothetical protein
MKIYLKISKNILKSGDGDQACDKTIYCNGYQELQRGKYNNFFNELTVYS